MNPASVENMPCRTAFPHTLASLYITCRAALPFLTRLLPYIIMYPLL